MNAEHEAELNRVKEAAANLGEHFDTVQIFCTRHEEGGEGGTVNIDFGSGNWFARYGQIATWMVKGDARTTKEVQEG